MKKIIFVLSILFCPLLLSNSRAAPDSIKPIIVFDFGGVIADVDPTAIPSYLQRTLHVSAPEAAKILQELRESRTKGIAEEEFWRQYAASTNTELPPNWQESLEIVQQSAVIPNPRMLDLVKKLKAHGYRVAMLSNVQKHQAKIVREKGLYLYFDPLLLSCEIGVEKPRMEAYQILISRLHAKPQDCLLIDDTPANSTAARQFGMGVILFHSVDELLAELKRRNIPEEESSGFHIAIR